MCVPEKRSAVTVNGVSICHECLSFIENLAKCNNRDRFDELEYQTKRLAENKVVETKELFRCTYNNGDIIRLMVQTYSIDTPFYFVAAKRDESLSVNSASSDIQDIIDFYKRKAARQEKELNEADYLKDNEKVRQIYEHCFEITKQFIQKAGALHYSLQQTHGGLAVKQTAPNCEDATSPC